MARTGLLERFLTARVAHDDDERMRLAKASLALVAGFVILITPVWVGTYLWLGRPLAAAIPGTYALFSIVTLAYMARTKRGRLFVDAQIAAILVLPIMLQAVLGGFAYGSAVAVWSFGAPIGALIAHGRRAAGMLFAAFLAGIVGLGLADPALRAATAPMPEAVRTAFFVLNVAAPLATNFGVLLYFNRQRDIATQRSEELLLNILPSAVAERLKRGEAAVADRVEEATVLFVDIVEFTRFADQTAPERVVDLLGRAFSALDDLGERHGLEKIKTLGDGYLAAAGVPLQLPRHAAAAADMALEVGPELARHIGADWPGLAVRIGLASGPVVAGVIGRRRFSFDLWGDTVNTASRMASVAHPGEIQVTEATCRLLGEAYRLERHEAVEVKGKGQMTTYTLLGRAPD
ncbi:MAG: adenylate/guanylate cyclase domain-containing protein [Candidatus Limnocylindria bacterium]